jgi:hypothetical protein
VQSVRQGDVDGVDVRVGEQGLIAVVDRADAVSARRLGRAIPVPRRDRGDLDAVDTGGGTDERMGSG